MLTEKELQGIVEQVLGKYHKELYEVEQGKRETFNWSESRYIEEAANLGAGIERKRVYQEMAAKIGATKFLKLFGKFKEVEITEAKP